MAILTDSFDVPDLVYISSTDLQSWTETELPYHRMSLTIYQSKFVAVGGWEFSTDEATNTILTSTTGRQWDPSIPPMPTKRCGTSLVSTSSPEVLVVAGGRESDREKLNIVEVLMTGHQWITVDPLPAPASEVRKECAAIRQQVVAALKHVGSHMNYGNFVDYQFAFECPSHPWKEHLCVVEDQSEVTKLMECLKHLDDRQPEKMGSCHTV